MTRNRRAIIRATVATGAMLAIFVIPVVNLFAYIFLMLPLWFVDDLGVVDLGSQVNGFFDPNATGYVFGIVCLWLFWFLVFRLFAVRDPLEGTAADAPKAVAADLRDERRSS